MFNMKQFFLSYPNLNNTGVIMALTDTKIKDTDVITKLLGSPKQVVIEYTFATGTSTV
jgi:hypothetical protein